MNGDQRRFILVRFRAKSGCFAVLIKHGGIAPPRKTTNIAAADNTVQGAESAGEYSPQGKSDVEGGSVACRAKMGSGFYPTRGRTGR